MCRVNFLASRRLVSGFLTMMKPVRLHRSVWRKNECSCFCFRGGAIRRLESRKNSRAGATSNRKDGPARCRRAKAFFSWLQFAARKKISRPTSQSRKSRGVPGGRVELPTNPECFRGCSSVANNKSRALDSSFSSTFFRHCAPPRASRPPCSRQVQAFCPGVSLYKCVLVCVEQISHLNQQLNQGSAFLRL